VKSVSDDLSYPTEPVPDIAAGKLDALAEEAIAEFQSGRCREI
jgi:hypothetical protein